MSDNYYVEFNSISKNFENISALNQVSLKIKTGQITALAGDNGSGKSTLIKILSGELNPTAGMIIIRGKQYNKLSPKVAKLNGISTVYQDLSLVEERDAIDNIFLGKELTKNNLFMNRREMETLGVEFLREFNIDIKDIYKPVKYLSGGQRQAIAIARAIHDDSELIIFDEPTAAMGVIESELINKNILKLKQLNKTIIIISHNINQILLLADNVKILKNGKLVDSIESNVLNRDRLISSLYDERGGK